MKRRLIALSILIVATAAGLYMYGYSRRDQNPVTSTNNSTSRRPVSPTPQPQKGTGFDKHAFSIDDPTSLWIVVNKKRPLQPAEYIPSSLVVPNITLRSNITGDERQVRDVTAAALEALAAAAKKQGITLTLESGYRSYNFQVNLYNRYVREQGKAVADTQSARAGHSEHQTGLAADVGGTTKPSCNVEACFAETPEGIWLEAHAYEYGFIIRYPNGKTPVTGYTYEPWHLRYVGKVLAGEMHSQNVQTLEEFFALPPAPDYN